MNEEAVQGVTPIGATPVPDHLIDDLLPALKDTELRILLIVLRQTVGRGGKSTDWLSHTQLQARTGRASEAISGAIGALVKNGYLAVTDAHGIPVPSTQERRRCRGRLYYHLTSQAWTKQSLPLHDGGKAKTTETEKEKHCRFRKYDNDKATEERTPEQRERIEAVKAQVRARLAKIRDASHLDCASRRQ